MRNIQVHSRLNHVMLATIGLFFILIQGCAGASSVNMVPDSYDILHRLDGSVTVEVDRSKAYRHFLRRVPDGEIKKALEVSLTKSGVFSRVSQSSDADYLLKVEITSVGIFWGLNFKAALNTTWKLTDLRTNTDVWEDFVRSESRAPSNICLGGEVRVRRTYEGVIKENIRLGINQLSEAMVAN